MDTNQNTRGIFFIMTGMAFFSIQDSLIKFIFEDIALFELYFGRTLIQSVFLLSFVLITKKTISKVLSFGEMLSSKIIFEILKEKGNDISYIDSREVIFTKYHNNNEVVDEEK